MSEPGRSRGWCFTLNNYAAGTLQAIRIVFSAELKPFQYIVMEHEVGESGTPHIQGYVYFTNQRTFNSAKECIKQMLGNQNAHIEKQKGTCTQAADYCLKDKLSGKITSDNDWLELGEKPVGSCEGGKSARLEALTALIADGNATREQIYDADPATYVRNHRGLQTAQEIKTKHRTWMTTGYWLWGPTGCGKSRWAFSGVYGDKTYDQDQIYRKPNGPWWDGYDPILHKVVVMDDERFSYDNSFELLLNALDRYPHQVPFKGGFKVFRAEIIIIATRAPPDVTFREVAEKGHTIFRDEMDQLYRRIREGGGGILQMK